MKKELICLLVASFLSGKCEAQPVLHQDIPGTYINIVPVVAHLNNPMATRMYLGLTSKLDSTVAPMYWLYDSTNVDSVSIYNQVDYGVLPAIKISNTAISIDTLKIMLFTYVCRVLGITYQNY